MLSGSKMRVARNVGRLGLVGVVSVSIWAGCGGVPPQNVEALGEAAAPPVLPQKLRLVPGDEIDVAFFYHPELARTVLVRPDGFVSLPHAGEILAAGREPDELSATIRQEFADVLKQPDVTVVVKGLASRRVYVGGEVSTPRSLDLVPGMTISQAIFAAGGFLNTGHPESVLLLRYRPRAKPAVATVDVDAVLDGTGVDPTLEPYDVVYVPKTLIAQADLFVEQYINDIIPRSVTFPFTYFFGGAVVGVP